MNSVKTTRYFEFTRNRPDRKGIRARWIDQAIKFPQAQQVQSDGRLQRWAWIEPERKWLRVILLEDGQTLHNAFFGRRYNGGKPPDPTETRS
jgi:hypothetical protein